MDPQDLHSPVNFEALVEALHDGVYCVDDQMRIVYWNRAAEEITGYRRDEVVGSRCADNILVHVDAAGRSMCRGTCPLRQTLADGRRRQSAAFLKKKAGQRLPVQIRSAPLRDREGRIVGAVEIFADDSASQALAARIADVEKMAMLDQLTQLPNRRYLEMTLELRVAELARYGWPFGVLLVDIDHFKQVNDQHGHEAGDAVLRVVSDTMSHSSRLIDLVGRWGGEEFVVILSHLEPQQLSSVAERLRALVASCVIPTGASPIQVSVSIGAAMAEPGEEALQVIERADRLLYRAKNDGRNRVAA